MANTIKIRRSATSGATPTTSQLALGELAINTYDGKLFLKKDDGSASVVEVGGDATATAQKVLLYEKANTGSADSFDGTETRYQLRNENGAIINEISSAFQLLISIDGVVQEPNSSSSGTDGFYITNNVASGTDIVFLAAPSSGSEFFGTAGVIERGSLATVATSGSYNDLTDTPSAGSSFSGSYADLTNLPADLETVTGYSSTLSTVSVSTVAGTSYNMTGSDALDFRIEDGNSAPATFNLERPSSPNAAQQAIWDALYAKAAAGTSFSCTIESDFGESAVYTITGIDSGAVTDTSVDFSYSSFTGTNDTFGDDVSKIAFTGLSQYAVTITGPNNPIFDTAAAVTIDGVEYASGDWSVSGSTATQTFATNPNLASGDNVFQGFPYLSKVGDVTVNGALEIQPDPESGASAAIKFHRGRNPTGGNFYIVDGDTSEPNHSQVNTNTVLIGQNVAKNKTDSKFQDCVSIGYSSSKGISGSTNEYLNRNTAIGAYSMEKLAKGSDNVGLGVGTVKSVSSSTSGFTEGNTGIGTYALGGLVNGDHNASLGFRAGLDVTTGSNNVLIGKDAGQTASPSGKITTGGNNVCIGNNSTTNAYIKVSWTVTSDQRDKADIEDFTAGLDFIDALRPVTYKWDERSKYLPEEDVEDPDFEMPDLNDIVPDGTHKGTRTEVGFLAQEIEAVEKQFGWANSDDDRLIASLNENETSYGVKYVRLIPILVNAIKELKAEIENLKSQIN